jgi:polyhydroxyalkanoate synthesis regulator protein
MKNRVAEAFGGGTTALENLTRQNFAMFERAMKMFTPFGLAGMQADEASRAAGGGSSAAPKEKPSEEISELKSEIEAMRKQLAELARERK